MREYVFRKVKEDDAESFIKHVNAVWKNAYKGIFPKVVFDKRDENVENKIMTFKEKVVERPQSIAYLVEAEEKIVATMTATLNSSYKHFKDKGYADLESIYVNPYFEGHGIAGHLKNIFVDWAKQYGAKKFVVGVLKDNTKARQVYKHWGGKLSNYTCNFEICGASVQEVFYEFDIK